MSEKEEKKSWFSKVVEEDLNDSVPKDEQIISVGIIIVGFIIVLYFIAHQISSTGFFTTSFGILEMFALYLFPIYWIWVSFLLFVGQKNLSRNTDAYGGLPILTLGIIWLFFVFPFNFNFFDDILPDFLRFLVQWISNDIARVLLLLLIAIHLFLAVFSTITRIAVVKARKQQV